MNPKLDRKYPAVVDIEKAALRALPKFIAQYLEYGMGQGGSVRRNRDALDAITLTPDYLVEDFTADISTELFGQSYAAPFGISPVGLGGFVWPYSAEYLAKAANSHKIPFAASTFALASLETLRSHAGEGGWFQLYRPNVESIEEDIISRAEQSGYEVLVVTVDIPSQMRRNHDIKNGFSIPPTMSARTIVEMLKHPIWTMAMIRAGIPSFENLTRYIPKELNQEGSLRYLTDLTIGHITPKVIEKLRKRWKGKLVLKGILSPSEAKQCEQLGVDGIIVSNHGGRQLEAAPSPCEVLSEMRHLVSDDFMLIADGGIRTGLDICRMLSRGADFVMMGRPFYYAIPVMGESGADHIIKLFKAELECVLGQIGCQRISDIRLKYAH